MTVLTRAPFVTAGSTPAVTADAMIRFPKVCPPATTIARARALFADDHVHALLVVDDGMLLAVVERSDLAGADDGGRAVEAGRLAGRVVGPAADLAAVRLRMARARTRRLAVVGDGNRLLGLLCLKRSGRGFCSETDVRSRAAAGRSVS